MRLWFTHNSEVPIYQQLSTQVVLAILCGDLKPGDRLPSTRELARRFSLHPNTASAGYRQLEQAGWAVRRHGSGVYVRKTDAPATPMQMLDKQIVAFFQTVRELGLSAEEVRGRVAQWMTAPLPDHFILIDPNPEARRILHLELQALTPQPVQAISMEEARAPGALNAAIPLCRPSQMQILHDALPMGTDLVTLPIRSPHAWLEHWLPAPEGHLVGLVSRWQEFLNFGKTMLLAAGFAPEAMLIRDASRRQWHRGLERTSAIICDAYTVKLPQLPKEPQVIEFRLLADRARQDLTHHLARFL